MDRDDIQGIVLHGYRSLPFARYHVLSFGAGEPRRALARLVDVITSAAEARTVVREQLALTASGLGALGLGEHELRQFSREFRQGMAHPERSAALGDSADEAPSEWEFGGPSTPRVDALCMTYARTPEQLAEQCAARARLFERFGLGVRAYDARVLAARAPSERAPRRGSRVPLGEFVLGEKDALGERRRGPFVPVKYSARPLPDWAAREKSLNFGQNGSYLALRKLDRAAPLQASQRARLEGEHAERARGPAASFEHRLLRRSREHESGLWFMAFNADLRRQFEFVQQSRCNARERGGARDPLVGREPGRPADESRHFRVRAGAYFFLPSIRALNYLAEPGA